MFDCEEEPIAIEKLPVAFAVSPIARLSVLAIGKVEPVPAFQLRVGMQSSGFPAGNTIGVLTTPVICPVALVVITGTLPELPYVPAVPKLACESVIAPPTLTAAPPVIGLVVFIVIGAIAIDSVDKICPVVLISSSVFVVLVP